MGEYIPAPYLVATSSLTDEQLRRCYQDFARSLEFAAAAPTLVFERLVANIVECLKSVARDTPCEARPPAAPPSRSPSSPPGAPPAGGGAPPPPPPPPPPPAGGGGAPPPPPPPAGGGAPPPAGGGAPPAGGGAPPPPPPAGGGAPPPAGGGAPPPAGGGPPPPAGGGPPPPAGAGGGPPPPVGGGPPPPAGGGPPRPAGVGGPPPPVGGGPPPPAGGGPPPGGGAGASPPSSSRPPPPPPIYPSWGSSSSNTASSSQAIKCRQPATGTFHTAEVLPPGAFTGASKLITFPQPYATPPRIVTGLRYLGIGPSGALRIPLRSPRAAAPYAHPPSGTLRAASCARATTCSDFTIDVDDYSKSRFSACASWLSVAPEDPDFQVGTFSTTAVHPYNENQREVSRRIVFERPYARPPQMTVWFSGLQSEPNGKLKAETWFDDVTPTGFLLSVSGDPGAALFSADVAWAACSDDRPNTWMGSFGISQPLPGGESGLDDLWGGGSNFKEESTSVFLAINSIAADRVDGLDLKISCLKVDTSGLSWCISTGDNSQVTKVGAMFIVLG